MDVGRDLRILLDMIGGRHELINIPNVDKFGTLIEANAKILNQSRKRDLSIRDHSTGVSQIQDDQIEATKKLFHQHAASLREDNQSTFNSQQIGGTSVPVVASQRQEEKPFHLPAPSPRDENQSTFYSQSNSVQEADDSKLVIHLEQRDNQAGPNVPSTTIGLRSIEHSSQVTNTPPHKRTIQQITQNSKLTYSIEEIRDLEKSWDPPPSSSLPQSQHLNSLKSGPNIENLSQMSSIRSSLIMNESQIEEFDFGWPHPSSETFMDSDTGRPEWLQKLIDIEIWKGNLPLAFSLCLSKCNEYGSFALLPAASQLLHSGTKHVEAEWEFSQLFGFSYDDYCKLACIDTNMMNLSNSTEEEFERLFKSSLNANQQKSIWCYFACRRLSVSPSIKHPKYFEDCVDGLIYTPTRLRSYYERKILKVNVPYGNQKSSIVVNEILTHFGMKTQPPLNLATVFEKQYKTIHVVRYIGVGKHLDSWKVLDLMAISADQMPYSPMNEKHFSEVVLCYACPSDGLTIAERLSCLHPRLQTNPLGQYDLPYISANKDEIFDFDPNQ